MHAPRVPAGVDLASLTFDQIAGALDSVIVKVEDDNDLHGENVASQLANFDDLEDALTGAYWSQAEAYALEGALERLSDRG